MTLYHAIETLRRAAYSTDDRELRQAVVIAEQCIREAGELRIEEINFFDTEEVYENCTVQVLSNSITGNVSVGWWKND